MATKRHKKHPPARPKRHVVCKFIPAQPKERDDRSPMTPTSLLARLTGGAVVAPALAVLGAWAAGSGIMLPGLNLFAPNTAAGFLLVGSGLLYAGSSLPRWRTVQAVLGGAAMLIAGAALVQHLADLPAHEAWLQPLLNVRLPGTPGAARMAYPTALALLLAGLVSIVFARAPGRVGTLVALGGMVAVLFIALLGFVGWATGAETLYGHMRDGQMSPYTAAGLVALAAGLWGQWRALGIGRRIALREETRIGAIAAGVLVFAVLFVAFIVYAIAAAYAARELKTALAHQLADRVFVLERAIAQTVATAAQIGRMQAPAAAAARAAAGRARPDELAGFGHALATIAGQPRVVAAALYNAQGARVMVRGETHDNPPIEIGLAPTHPATLLWDERLLLNVTLPLRESNRPAGYLVLTLTLPLAEALFGAAANLDATRELRLCASQDALAMRCFPSRSDFQTVAVQSVAGALPLPMDRALRGESGIASDFDHRGQEVIAAYAPAVRPGLGAVLQVREREFFLPLRNKLLQTLPVIALVVALGVGLLWRQAVPLARAASGAHRRLAAVFDHAGDGIVICRSDGTIESVNPAAVRMFGYTAAAELAGRPLKALFPGRCNGCNDAAGCLLTRPVALCVQAPRRVTTRVADGRELIVEVAVDRFEHEGGPRCVAVVRDISERARIEAQLRASEAQLRATFEQAAVGMVHIAPDSGAFLRANRRFCDMLGYSEQELCRLRYHDVLAPEDLPQTAANLRGLFAGEYATYSTDRRLRRKDGTYIWLRATISLVHDAAGAPAYIFAVGEDVDERKRAEDALRESEARFATVAANLPGMFCQVRRAPDGATRFVYVSEGSMAVCGLAPAAIEADAETLFRLIEPQDRARLLRAIEDSARALGPLNWEGRLIVSPDDVKWVNLRASPRAAPAGGGVVWEGLMFNITEGKRIEAEIRASRARLRQLTAHLESVREEERTAIAREIHDELGQWLTVFRMDVAWLRKNAGASRATRAAKLEAMDEVAESAIGVVRRIAADLRPAVLDLGLTAAVEWQTHEFERHAGIPCDLRTIGAAEAIPGGALAAAVFRILQEALTNVARHAQASAVQVTLERQDGTLRLEVSDNGRGMSRAGNGKSLGLLGMRERARALGGAVEIDGASGRGTIVTLRVPLDGGERGGGEMTDD